jgi:hypothetical protein
MAAVHDALCELGGDVLMLDQRNVDDLACEIHDGPELRGFIRCGDRQTPLEAITACYVRPYDTRRVPAVERAGPTSSTWTRAVQLDELLLGWLEITPALVVNRPSAMLPNGSKPHQLTMIAAAGFSVPETLVTTDQAEALAFWERHGQVIYKSISGVRSRVARLERADRERLRDVVHCPTQFQEYIPGRDYRAHVVGHDVYGCEIRSRAADYRYSGVTGEQFELWASRLPRDVEDRIVRMTRRMNLEVAGVDLRRTPDGDWVCFEVNPSPGFTFYETFAGQGVAHAIARHLMTGPAAASARV